MAQRIPKRLQDLSGIPAPAATLPTLLCRRSDGSYQWLTISDLLADIASDSGAISGQQYYIDISGSAGGAIALPSGLEASGELGAVTASGVRNETGLPAGIEATGELGVVTAEVAGGATGLPAGVEAVGELGTVTADGVRNETALPAGIEATGELGTVTADVLDIPSTPTQSALTVGNGQLTANWSDVTGETSYTVYYSDNSGLNATTRDGTNAYDAQTSRSGKITGVSANAVSQVITGLTNGTTYYTKISASNAAGESALSSSQNAAPASGGSGDETLYPSFDGYVAAISLGDTWSTARNAASGDEVDSAGTSMELYSWRNVFDGEEDDISVVGRGFLAFTLPAGMGTVTTAELAVSVTAGAVTGGSIALYEWTEGPGFDATDFNGFGSTLFGSVNFNSNGRQTISLTSDGRAYLNSVGAGGTARFCIRNHWDSNNTQPDNLIAAGFTVAASETTGTGSDPTLRVVW